ncbi:tetratricopeptide repeat protein [bacterium]|nr:tetratricopeptide repeat protein [bacterium]
MRTRILLFLLAFIALALIWGCKPQPEVQTEPVPQEQSNIKALEYEIKVAFSNGYEYYKNKQYSDAIQPFKKILELDKNCETEFCEKAYRYLADTYIRLEMPDTAENIYKEAISKFPSISSLHSGLAFIYLKDKQRLVNQRNSILTPGDSISTLSAEEMIEYDIIQDSTDMVTTKAIEEYKKSVELDPNDNESMNQLGRIYLEEGKLDDAVEWYEKSGSVDSNNVDIWNILVKLYETRRNNEGLMLAYQNLNRLLSEDQDIKLELGRIHGVLGNFEEALSVLEEYNNTNPQDAKGYHYLGLVYFRQKRYSESLDKLKEAAKLNPENPRIQVDIAEVYRDLKKYKTASNYIDKALGIDRSYYYAYFVLGEIYEQYGMAKLPADATLDMRAKLVFEEATAQYRKALKDAKWNTAARNKIDFLKQYLATGEEKTQYKFIYKELPKVYLEDL